MSEGLRGLFSGGQGTERSYDHDRALAADRGDGCSYTKIRRSKCATEQNPQTGKLVKKCEKTEELLRRCAGRPLEIIESKTEFTEEDVSSDVIIGQDDVHVFEETPLGWNRFFNDQDFNSPGLLRLFENPHEFSDRLLDGLEDFLHTAEETTCELLGQFGFFNAEGRKDSEIFRGFIDRFPDIFSKGGHLESDKADDSSLPSGDKTSQLASKFSDFSKDYKEV
ncbi:hypothetical protein O6H91_13G001700 [Diphasiastrum complanatum]|uniref:Uncharacterized protein n=1 Tax=Diphasiastrum complanatum TaxID=34168 RepID=A0ACC2BRS6_DIPCM|nr:hypothetical protein O6H91_13G001700 [Diphasiastrum complanatum]